MEKIMSVEYMYSIEHANTLHTHAYVRVCTGLFAVCNHVS